MGDMQSLYFKLNGEVTLVSVGDGGALLDITRKCYYDLNDTAFHILTLLEEGSRYRTVLAELIANYDIDRPTVERDVHNFIDDLLRLGIIETTTKEADRGPGTAKTKKGTNIYQTPVIEYKSELAVACAPTGPI